MPADEPAVPLKLAGPNPFIGPRPFEPGERLYGRDREIAELIDRLNSERIILLHSPSGAGKSSLLQAGLLPELTRSFDIWGPTRVNLETPADDDSVNRYVASANQGFEEAVPKEMRRPAETLAGQTLAEYFTGRPRRRRAPRNVLMVFDQFEEVLTVDPLAVAAKRKFFDQLGDLLRNPRIWALFALREDYLAPLEGGIERVAGDSGEEPEEVATPYTRRVPTHFKNRFRIDLLSLGSAREAMVEPARVGDREFPAVDRLVHDLATLQVQLPDGSFRARTGHYVEPVQLQVVCRRLWDAMPPDDLSIDPEDLERFGDVGEALGAFYDDSVTRVAGGEVAVERGVREWFDMRLITTSDIRKQVLMESETSSGLANKLIARLRDSHLVRAEQRAGATWFELAHDRLIKPVRESNAAWFAQHLSEVQKRASLWEQQDRTPGLLMKDDELAAGERWAARNKANLTEVEQRFLEGSRKAQDAIEREHRQVRWIKGLAFVAAIVAFLAVIAAVLAGWQWLEAKAQTEAARRAAVQARDALRIAAARERAEDPSLQVALLREVETDNPEALRGWRVLARAALRWPLAEVVYQGHREKVIRVAPDGARVVTVSANGRAQVRDVDGSKQRDLNREQGGKVQRAVFSPDGQRVVTTSTDNFALLWDVDGSSDPVELGGHEGQVLNAAFSPDSARLVTTATDNFARLWSIDDSSSSVKLGGHQGQVIAVFSDDGTHIVTRALDDPVARAWNVSGDVLADLGHPGPVLSVAVSSDGSRVVTVSEGEIAAEAETARLWNAGDWRKPVVLTRYEGKVQSARFSPGGQRFMIASWDGNVRLWHADDPGKPVVLLHESLHSATFSADGKRVVTLSTEGDVRVWNADDSGKPVVFPGHEGRVLGAELSQDGMRAMAVAGNNVRLWNADGSGDPIVLRGHEEQVSEAIFNLDGSRVVTRSDDSARWWNVEGTSEPVVLKHEQPVRSAAFSHNGQTVVTVSIEGTIRRWSVDGSDETSTLWGKPLEDVKSVVLSPDGKHVVTVSGDGAVRLWNAKGEPVLLGLTRRCLRVLRSSAPPSAQTANASSQPLAITPPMYGLLMARELLSFSVGMRSKR